MLLDLLRALLDPGPAGPLRMYRQGDVLLRSVPRLPWDAVRRPREGSRFVLAYGETTGHAHAVAEIHVEAYERDGVMYLRIEGEPATLRHEEHAPIAIAPGNYVVTRQREYVPRPVTGTREGPEMFRQVED